MVLAQHNTKQLSDVSNFLLWMQYGGFISYHGCMIFMLLSDVRNLLVGIKGSCFVAIC